MSGRLAGQVALIAGGARGAGRAQAVRLAEEGADLILLDSCSADETVRYIESLGRRAVAVEVGTRDQAALDAAVTDGVRSLGRLDVVCITHGHSLPDAEATGATLDLPAESWQSMLDLALSGVWRTCKAVIPRLLEPHGDGGSIVLTAPGPNRPGRGGHLAVAEHGLIGLMRTLAAELAPHRVRVNAVTPTGPGTADTQDHSGVADVTLFLASSEGCHLTGAALPVPTDFSPR